MMTPEQRYYQDAAFKQLVDVMEHFIIKADYTPTELREAAMLAAIHYEYHAVRSRFIFRDDDSLAAARLGQEKGR